MMRKSSCLLVAFMLLLMIHSSLSSTRCEKHELEALLKFKHSFTRGPMNRLSSWVGDDCCRWLGVTCDSGPVLGNVIKLNLQNQQAYYDSGPVLVSSELSSALLELKFLSHLDLSWNNFNMSRIPDFIGSMTSLRYLNLSHAGFSGLLPPQLGNLTNLIHLDLSYALGDFMPQKRLEWANGLWKLQTLDLAGINLAYAYDTLQVLFRFPYLSSLSLSGCYLNNTHSSELLITNISETMSSTLRHLDLSYNHFEGLLPSFLRKFGSLHFLSLGGSGYSGSVPTWLESMMHLEFLDLSLNEIYGTFPSVLGKLTTLIHLDLSYNKISSLTSLLGQLINLNYLGLSSNRLQGQVPTFLAKMSGLKYLDLSENELSGSFPPNLWQLTEIEYLDISSNFILGTISGADIGNLSKLLYFDTSFNNFNLNLSIDWQPPFQLEVFYVHSCKINAVFPQWLRNQTQILSLGLSNTGISGELPQWIWNLTNLQGLQLAGNKLTGSLPRHVTCDGCNLAVVDLRSNMLSGSIPHWLLHLDTALVVDLSDNLLSGAIFERENSSSLFNSENLILLDLSHNMFSGEIRIKNVFSGTSLEILSLRGNDFTGIISPRLCLLRYLTILDLAHNRFTGHIPRCLGSVAFSTAKSSLIIITDLEIQEIIKGVIENLGGYYEAHSMIDLSSNRLIGAIPEELTNISKLMALNLSKNHLTGGIPEGIGNLHSLESLDLSNNNLSGTIPQSLTAIQWISLLNLSNNNLHGPIPTGSQLQTLVDPSIYAGNSGLCGFPLPKCGTLNPPPIPSDDGSGADDDGEDKNEQMWFYMFVMSGVATGFWVVVGTLVFKKRWRHAYFRFVEETADRIYVPLKVRVNSYRNRLR